MSESELKNLARMASDSSGQEIAVDTFRLFGLRRYRLSRQNPRVGTANLIYSRATARQVEVWLRAYQRGIEDGLVEARRLMWKPDLA